MAFGLFNLYVGLFGPHVGLFDLHVGLFDLHLGLLDLLYVYPWLAGKLVARIRTLYLLRLFLVLLLASGPG